MPKQLEDINRHNGSILKRTRDLWSHFFPNSSWNRKLDKFADQTRLSNGVPKSRQVSDLCRVNDRTPVGQLFNQLFTRVRAVNRFYQQLLHPWCDSQSQTSRGVTGREDGRREGVGGGGGGDPRASSRRVSIPRVVTRCTRVYTTVLPSNRATGLSIRAVLTRPIVLSESHSADTVSCRCRRSLLSPIISGSLHAMLCRPDCGT